MVFPAELSPSPPKTQVKSHPPGPENGTLSGNKGFTEVIELR